MPSWNPGADLARGRRQLGRVGDDAADDEHQWVTTNRRKIGVSAMTDSFAPAQVEHDEPGDEHDLDRQLERRATRRQEAEDGVAAGGDRDGDGQDVVDQQRPAGDDAGQRPEQLGGHDVAAAAVRELLDDAAVRGRDDEHGEPP